MQIQEIQFTNFRALESFRMDFDPRATVIVGKNATGKTTILDGIALALADWTRAFLPEEDLAIAPSDPRLVTTVHEGTATTGRALPVVIKAVGGRAELFGGRPCLWSRSFGGQEGESQHRESTFWHDAKACADSVLQGNAITLPVIAHYITGRSWTKIRSLRRKRKGDRETTRAWGYHDALSAGSDAKGLEEWMEWREADRVQRIAQALDEGKDPRAVKSPQLEAVTATALSCLESAKRFYHSANYRQIRVDFEDGSSIPFDALSDGQRNIIAIAADIAWRAAQLNPHLGSNVALETPGIVLIDEIDLHLHPAWQLHVLDNLLRAFPKMQFIVTTHSPLVMSAAPRDSVRLLDTAHNPHRIHDLPGRDVNSILEDIFGVPSRPPQWKEKLDRLARLTEDGAIEEATALIKELEDDGLSPQDSALVAARWELQWARGDHAAD